MYRRYYLHLYLLLTCAGADGEIRLFPAQPRSVAERHGRGLDRVQGGRPAATGSDARRATAGGGKQRARKAPLSRSTTAGAA